MVEERRIKMKEKQTEEAALSFEEKVLETVVEASLNNIEGLLSVKGTLFLQDETKPLAEVSHLDNGLEIEVKKQQVSIRLTIIIEFGKDLSRIFTEIKRTVAEEVQRMTNLEVVEVDVHVADVVTKEEYANILSDYKSEAENVKR
jgi:uncharacterized alkaline shock family protein YloU